jgi:competence protein ComEA
MKKFLFLLMASTLTLFALDINTATKAELVKIKGIGEKKAERIIAYREEHGAFKSIDELKNVKGIGGKLVAVIKSEVSK